MTTNEQNDNIYMLDETDESVSTAATTTETTAAATVEPTATETAQTAETSVTTDAPESGVAAPLLDTEVTGKRDIPRGAHRVFLTIAGLAFAALAVVFLFLPRETYSELEKRDLAKFPDPADYAGEPGKLTAAISQWFSDSEPYRDSFMTLSMSIRDAFRVAVGGDEAVTFRPSATGQGAEGVADPNNPLIEDIDNPLANENAKVANAGIVIVGSGKNVRALMAYGAGEKGAQPYIDLVAEYARRFPSKHIYALISPTATEYYLPAKAAKVSKSQRATIEYARQHMPSGVRFVDVYSALAQHVNEDIFLRTDHYWAPLGGFYAARELARSAGVPFKELDNYDRHVIHGYVGSMYGYSKDIAVKNAPEDFVFYTPRGASYSTTYISYKTNEDYQVVSQSAPYQGEYFHKFKDGSGNAYLTFMGGDQHLVKVKTGVPGNRKILIVKDSFGNTIPGYLFYSFSEIHVVDFRYFKNNMVDYVNTNGITDICLAFNIFNCCNPASSQKVKTFLKQRTGDFSVTPVRKDETTKKTDGDSPAKSPGDETKETPAQMEKHEEPAPAPEQEPEPKPEPKPEPNPAPILE